MKNRKFEKLYPIPHNCFSYALSKVTGKEEQRAIFGSKFLIVIKKLGFEICAKKDAELVLKFGAGESSPYHAAFIENAEMQKISQRERVNAGIRHIFIKDIEPTTRGARLDYYGRHKG